MADDNPIRNTADMTPEMRMLLLLAGPLGGGSPDFIYEMEKQGQKELASQNSRLPSEGSTDPIWEKLGFKWGDPVDGDPLFRNVEMPAGWSIKPTNHDMHSDLLDDKGRKRGSVFYKAAFYDRKAMLHTAPRYSHYSIGVDPNEYAKSQTGVVKDWDGTVVFKSEVFEDNPDYTDATCPYDQRAFSRAYDAAKNWLKANYPDFSNPAAYWD